MVQFEELKLKLEGLKPEIDDLSDALGLSAIKSEIQQLENRAAEPGFYDDIEKSQKILKRTSDLNAKVDNFNSLVDKYEDTLTLIELGDEEEDLSLLEEAESEVAKVEEILEKQRLQTLLTGEYDKNNAILTFHAGSGGTEAQDWAEMLYRMYTRWAADHGFNVKEVDYLEGDEAGLKSAVLLVEGENAYGYLKSEAGVHRLVRVSPFDSAGRRHTSFSSLEVMPQRVSIGRAIVKNPDILLCDEPTGALDYNTSKEILKLIEDVNKKYGNTIIMVTHNEAIQNMADHVIKLRDGAVRHNKVNTEKVSAEDLEW